MAASGSDSDVEARRASRNGRQGHVESVRLSPADPEAGLEGRQAPLLALKLTLRSIVKVRFPPQRGFFSGLLGEIENVVKTNFNKPVEFVRLAEAAQYRQSLSLRAKAVQ